MENQIMTIIIAVMGATVGAFLGSYLSKKGELKAIEHNFEEIKKQLKETTRISHKIQSEVSRDFWIDQQRWELRRDLYLGLIENLNEAKFTLLEIYRVEFDESDETSNLRNSDEEKSNRERLVRRMQYRNEEANRKIRDLIDKSGILFLSNEAIEVLKIYLNAETNRMKSIKRRLKDGDVSAEWESVSWYDYLESQGTAVSNAYDEIVKTAKADLQINK